MELSLTRYWPTPVSTVGELKVDGQHECYTLELPMKDGKPGSAIPAGSYGISITFSPKFGRLMPLVNGIPERSDIRIHWGNTAEDTDGCILVGQTRHENFVGNSRLAFEAVWPKIIEGVRQQSCRLTVEDVHPVLHPDLSTQV